MPTPSQVTGGHSGCHRPRGFLVSDGITGHQCESAQSGGEPTPPEPQRKADRVGEPGSPSTEEEERTQPGHSRRAEAPLSPAPTEAVGRTPERPSRQGAFQGRAEPPNQAASPGTDDRKVRQRTHGIPRGEAPPSHDTPERLRLRLRWTPRPVPELSKPSLILLHAGKDDAGALDAYLLLGVHLGSGHQAKGWRY